MNPGRHITIQKIFSALSALHFASLSVIFRMMFFFSSLALFSAEHSEGERLFALKVKPLFAEKCMACHGSEPEKVKGGFNMLSRTSTLKGGESYGEDVLMQT